MSDGQQGVKLEGKKGKYKTNCKVISHAGKGMNSAYLCCGLMSKVKNGFYCSINHIYRPVNSIP